MKVNVVGLAFMVNETPPVDKPDALTVPTDASKAPIATAAAAAVPAAEPEMVNVFVGVAAVVAAAKPEITPVVKRASALIVKPVTELVLLSATVLTALAVAPDELIVAEVAEPVVTAILARRPVFKVPPEIFNTTGVVAVVYARFKAPFKTAPLPIIPALAPAPKPVMVTALIERSAFTAVTPV